MAYGDGSIRQMSKGVWQVRLDLGDDPITGKRRRIARNVRGTKADARRVRNQMLKEYESGIKVDKSKVTLSEFIEIWADARRMSGKSAEDTVVRDCGKLKHVEKYIGHVPIREIDAATIERVYALVQEEAGLGGTSMHNIHVQLKSVFRKAVDYDLILRNPCDRVDAPKKDDPERRSLDMAESMRFAKAIDRAEREEVSLLLAKEQRMEKLDKTTSRKLVRGLSKLSCIQACRIAQTTGMRKGEILALEWGNVNLERGTISVVQSRTQSGEIKPPKTKAGKRVIHIDDVTCKSLKRLRALQKSCLASLGIEPGEKSPVCCSDKGDYMDSANFERFWRKLKSEWGFEGLKFHELRHTQATQLLANGVDVKTVQTRLGHASPSITLGTYAHAVPENDEAAADLFGSIIHPSNVAPLSAQRKTA